VYVAKDLRSLVELKTVGRRGRLRVLNYLYAEWFLVLWF
jgi:hypothetical protein